VSLVFWFAGSSGISLMLALLFLVLMVFWFVVFGFGCFGLVYRFLAIVGG